MTHTDDALTDAVAKDMWHSDANERWVVRSVDDNAEEWRLHKDFYNSEGYDPFGFFPAFMLAKKALTTIRAHDEQAALNCGHCTPNTDEIACACVVQGREDDDPFISCPDCHGTGIVGGPDPACPTCGARGSIPAFALKIKERDDE